MQKIRAMESPKLLIEQLLFGCFFIEFGRKKTQSISKFEYQLRARNVMNFSIKNYFLRKR